MMKRMKYKDLYIAALLPLAMACSSQTEDVIPTPSDTPVKINTSRAEGTGSGDYALLFWQGNANIASATTDVWGTNKTWLEHSLAAGTGEDQVDYYHFTDGQDYPVTNSSQTIYYPANNSPIYAVGYYPQSNLTASEDKSTLTLTTGTPGLVDVCSTDVEQGTESNPFINDQTHELVYRHTLVRLRFYAMRHRNTYQRYSIKNIKATIDGENLCNTWSFKTGTERGTDTFHNVTVANGESREDGQPSGMDGYFAYVAQAPTESNMPKDLVFITPDDEELQWLGESDGDIQKYNLYPEEGGTNIFRDKENTAYCYVRAEAFKRDNASENYYLPLKELEATSIDLQNHSKENKLTWTGANARKVFLYQEKESIDKDGNLRTDVKPLKEQPKPGESYDIVLVFEGNYFTLWGEKGDWIKGGIIYVPLNPNNQATESN